jgi:hypothetical protein
MQNIMKCPVYQNCVYWFCKTFSFLLILLLQQLMCFTADSCTSQTECEHSYSVFRFINLFRIYINVGFIKTASNAHQIEK